ncbi:MAG: peptidylprolyl isomerase [Candidatus Diapherotrites archaeon]|nr:peptidylprolyl isomerase [Candidatus Diapherotrites archaeon]
MKKAVLVVCAVCAILLVLLLNGCTNTNQATDSNANLDLNNAADKNGGGEMSNFDKFVKAKAGDTVSVHYIGKYEDGNIFDSSVGKSPFTFELGKGDAIPGFEEAIIGMRAGETKTVTIPPEKAYGAVNPNKIVTFDRNSFSKFSSLEIGMGVSADDGLEGRIEAFNDKNVTINFNHFLAGKTLVFDFTLVTIEKKN